MHLALAIGGCTLDELDERMTEVEFQLWGIYANTFFLPERRAALQAAQTALHIAVSMGGVRRTTPIEEFLVKPAPIDPDMDADIGSAMISAATSSRIYKLGQGRKKP